MEEKTMVILSLLILFFKILKVKLYSSLFFSWWVILELDLLEESDRRKKTQREWRERGGGWVWEWRWLKLKVGTNLYIYLCPYIYIYMHMLIQYFVWGYTKIIVIYVIIRVCVPYGVGLTWFFLFSCFS